MARTHLVLAALILPLAAVAGCLSDVQRAGLDVSWRPQAVLLDGPAMQASGWPVVLTASATAGLEGADSVEVTAALARLGSGDEDEVTELSAFELAVGDERLDGEFSEDLPIPLRDGDAVEVAFGFAPGRRLALTPGDAVPVRIEVQWRYRGDGRFDAGRLLLEANLSVVRAPYPGLGAAELQGDRVTRLVFESVGRNVTEETAPVSVVLVTTGGPRSLAPLEARLSPGDGVALADLTPNMRVPDDPGYVVLTVRRGDGSTGTVVLAAGPTEDAVPGPGTWLVLVGVLAAALVARRPR